MAEEKQRNSTIKILIFAFGNVFGKPYSWIITAAITVFTLILYYLILVQNTTWDAFLQSNASWYVLSQIILSILNAFFIGIAVSFFVYLIDQKRQSNHLSFLNTLGTLFFSSIVTGCSVCSSVLLPTLGITVSLTAFPFGGLEVKFIALFLVFYGIWEYAKSASGLCPITKERLISTKDGRLVFTFNRNTLPQLMPLLLLLIFGLFVYLLPRLPIPYRAKIQAQSTSLQKSNTSASVDTLGIMEQINPSSGYEINASYGDIGPKMLAIGVIDLDKFRQVYNQAGQPLTPEQEQILTKGSDKKIKITKDNSYFLLNFFWAFGLANKNKVLTDGEMTKYGKDKIGNFASTGGWTLGREDAMSYYAKQAIIPLSAAQEDLVNRVASNIYRPCCGNSTAFPDCNHGMALLGILEIMAANGATEGEMYNAAKYINAFWFPSNYFDIALYFKHKEGKDYKDVDAKRVLSRDFSSAFGMQNVKKWLVDNGIVEKPPVTSSGCGI